MTPLELALRGGTGSFRLEVPPLRIEGPAAVVGPNGAGKTTLLRLLLGALRPDAGYIRLGSVSLFDAASGVDLPVEERQLGYVPQLPVFFGHLDVADNVSFGLRGPKRARRERAEQALAALGLSTLLLRTPQQLSGGERQKVALARALARSPRALLLDEPLSALDVDARVEVRGWLHERLQETPLPALLVTHDGEDVRVLTPRVLALDRGALIADGTPAELGERTAFLRALLS